MQIFFVLYTISKKHQDDLAVRRKVIFRFFSQLSNDETPLIFSSIFSSILCVHPRNTTDQDTSEAHKEQVLYDFFKNAKESNSSRILTEERSCIEKGRLKGQWNTVDGQYFIVIDTTIIRSLPMLAGIVLNITEIVNQMRLCIREVSIFLFESSLEIVRILEESCQLLNSSHHATLSFGNQQEKTLLLNGTTLIKNNQYYR
jgi:hypothetical protein